MAAIGNNSFLDGQFLKKIYSSETDLHVQNFLFKKSSLKSFGQIN
jgi:hypothetical protein